MSKVTQPELIYTKHTWKVFKNEDNHYDVVVEYPTIVSYWVATFKYYNEATAFIDFKLNGALEEVENV